MIIAFGHCCYEPQWPEAADGLPPQPRLVDHILTVSHKILWPAATTFLPPTVDRYQNSEWWLVYCDTAAAIAANGVLFGSVGAGVYLIGHSLGKPQS